MSDKWETYEEPLYDPVALEVALLLKDYFVRADSRRQAITVGLPDPHDGYQVDSRTMTNLSTERQKAVNP